MFSCLVALTAATIGSAASQAQAISGTIRNGRTHEPVPFVNLGLPKRNLGTVADEQGRYQLAARPEYATDTVRVSSLGYEPLLLPLRTLLAQPNLELQPQAVELGEVAVAAPGAYRDLRTVGLAKSARGFVVHMTSNQLGTELGALVHLPKRPALLQSLNVVVAKNDAGPLTFRLNLYRLDAWGFPTAAKLLSHDVLLTATPQAGVLTVDLAAEKVVLDEDFLMGLELVQVPASPTPLDLTKQISFGGALELGGQLFVRLASQGQWIKPTVTSNGPLLGRRPAVALYATVKE
ncbi:carboxypeptidase-like regulatory domain-containing protein [Hymenobacter jeollabukensis]|uniref:carboxypeptidase-like regulatory domain-containing protein n=1 Tax=Hymenobacter jeollabukensis TaxID=2025313 RepID=UPI001484FC32|nr:carboxypeptidase-like regulatory domain-containing protein [Hymenobacter jeollabukensis]